MKENLITALYERLSRDDDLDGESNSIVNQKLYLQNYADEHGFTNCKHYTDDGWSGGNFDRPGWKSLIADVEAGKVGVILAKDMSRIGRNYLETGFYTEVVFRKHNVRFIAIANGVDNDHPETGEFVPFLNIMNEWYLKDQSKKVTAAYQLRGKSGLPTNNNCLYGYRKDPDVKHHWLVDEEAAAIVRRIYQMACEGHGPSEIARILTKEHYDNIYQLDEETAGKVFSLATHVAKAVQEETGCEGLNIVQNNGEVAGQTVHHFHMHVIPRHAGDDVQVTWKQGETESESLKALADAIKKHI